jgi:hypothetical protein
MPFYFQFSDTTYFNSDVYLFFASLSSLLRDLYDQFVPLRYINNLLCFYHARRIFVLSVHYIDDSVLIHSNKYFSPFTFFARRIFLFFARYIHDSLSTHSNKYFSPFTFRYLRSLRLLHKYNKACFTRRIELSFTLVI